MAYINSRRKTYREWLGMSDADYRIYKSMITNTSKVANSDALITILTRKEADAFPLMSFVALYNSLTRWLVRAYAMNIFDKEQVNHMIATARETLSLRLKRYNVSDDDKQVFLAAIGVNADV